MIRKFFISTVTSSPLFKLIRNSFYYGIGDILQKFMSVLMLPIYTRYLAPDDYGILALLAILIIIVSTITMFGLTNGISRYFYYPEEHNVTISEVVWSPLFFVIVSTLVVCILLTLSAQNLSVLLFDKTGYEYLIKLTLASIFVANISGIGRSILIFQERVLIVNLINISGVFIGALSGIVMVVYLERGVQGAVEASLVSSILMFFLNTFFSLRGYKPSFNLGILIKQLKFSMPLMIAIFAFILIDSSDRYLLKMFLPLSELGLYNIGYQIGMVMMIFVGGFVSAWPPHYHKSNKTGDAQKLCNNVLQFYILIGAIFAVLISISAPLLIQLLTTDEYSGAYTVVPWVAFAYLLKGPYIIFLMGVLMKNKTSWQLYLEIVAAIVNIVLNIILIPIIGREAAAMTTLLSYGIMVVGSYYMVSYINPIPSLDISKPLIVVTLAIIISVGALIPELHSEYLFVSPVIFVVFIFILLYLYKKDLNLFIGSFYNKS